MIDFKNLCIVYPGATGGNHLANMLSLCDEFNALGYHISKQHMMYKYIQFDKLVNTSMPPNALKAHFSLFTNLAWIKDDEIYQKKLVSIEKNLFHGHTHDYHSACQTRRFQKFTHFAWLILTYPEPDSIVFKRKQAMGMIGDDPDLYTLPYTPHPLLATNIIADETNSVIVKSENIFSIDGIDYFADLIKQNFDITMPNICKDLHKLWFKWINLISNVTV